MAARNPINLIFRGINIVLIVFCALFINASQAEASPVLYYGQSYSPYEMRYANLSQSDIMKTIYTSPHGTIKAVAIDSSNRNLYFSDPVAGIIYSSKLDGSSVTPYLTGVYAEGVAVDAVHNFFYYTQSHTDSNNVEHYDVVRANLTNPLAAPTVLYTSATGTPEAITVAENGDLYFSDPHESVAKIYKAASGASNPVEFMTGVHAYGLAVAGEYLYYTEAFEPDFKVRKVSLANTSTFTDLYTAPAGAPKAMTVFGNELYFANQHSSVAQVCKINLDTGNQSSVLSNVNAGGIAILNNTPPVVSVNTGITTNENNAAVINNLVLQVTDLESDDPAGLIFKVGTVPGKGKLTQSGLEISAGGTFSQSDINSGLISYVPNPAVDGPDSFTLTVSDGMGGSTGATVSITINTANNAPSFTKGADQTVLEDAGAQTIAGWATAMSVGPADESSQTYEFSSSNNNNSLFTVQPQLSHDGTLTYTPAANACGTATVDVIITDNGGTANGGADSSTQTFTITVTGVNDSPSFTKGPDQTVPEGAGATTITGWATGISAGPNESSQTLSFTVTNNNNALFLVQPAISADGILSFSTVNNLHGSATVTVTLHDDGGTANGGADMSSSQEFTITVVNLDCPDPPTGVSATAGDRRATVRFSAPASNGGSAIILYTVTSSPGGKTATGSGSPIIINGLTNGTAYTFTVTATNSLGTSAASGPSNCIIPAAPYYPPGIR